MEPRFIHLRVHTEYSLSDGIVQIDNLMDQARQFNMPAIAVTDQSNVFSAIKFYQAAIHAKIKPLIGADVWLENDKDVKAPYCLTLLCQHNKGYKNLLELISRSYTQGQAQGKAIIQRAWLTELADGLIIISGAEEGDLGRALLAHETIQTKQLLDFWLQHFPNRYYIELRRTGQTDQENYIDAALMLAEAHALPVVATNNVRFIKRDDFEAHETRVCIHEGFILADPRRPRRYTDQQYLRSQEEMLALFADVPEALVNTVELAKRCNVTLTLGKSFLPRFPVPVGFTIESYLCHAAQTGLDDRLKIFFDHADTAQRAPYDARLQTELAVINKMGFAGYFLIVADFTRWARENGVPVGPGRGSGPGSLVAYALKITDLDPLQHDLLFERFLNPDRVSMPDFDIDFCMEGRDRVIDYVMQTHGLDAVAQIITYGTMTAKAVIRDVGRVLGMNYGHVDKIAKLVPFEIGITLDAALQQEELLRERYQQEEDVRTLIDLARKLEGITRNAGKHAGGVVIAPSKLTEYTALYCEEGQSHHLVTQFDKDDVEAVGLVKFDFLGLRTLTIIDWALQEINSNRQAAQETALDIQLVPLNDPATFALLKSCKTTAIFQLESRGMKDLVKRLQPDCFEDIVALVALFRPGPLQSGMVDDFINRKHGRARVMYPHPALEPILRPTYGVILYQEQVMQIAQVLAGYSLGSADLLRRAMGKKKAEEMALHRETFCKGAMERGVNFDTATHIFDLMEKFAGYGFNKSHSASYALIAYQTAWLKAHYPAEYMAAVLSADMDNTDKVVHFVEECQALNLQVIPPNVNRSIYRFKAIDKHSLLYGLGAIKGAGEAAIEMIVEERNRHGEFKDLFDFCRRLHSRKINRRLLEAFIKAGALDTIAPHRAAAMASLNQALQHAEQKARDHSMGQHDLFGSLPMQDSTIQYVHAPEWSEQQRLFGEKETLGLYLTGHPIHRYLSELKNFTNGRLTALRPSTKTIVAAGIITNIRTIQTKRGDRMAVVTLDDATTPMDVLCFAENYHKYRELLGKDKLIIVEGEVSVDDFSGGLRLLSREIFSIDTARERYAKYLQIRLSPTFDVAQLVPLLEKYRGGRCYIAVDYWRADTRANLKLGEAWRIRPVDSLLDTLRDVFSAENVDVVY